MSAAVLAAIADLKSEIVNHNTKVESLITALGAAIANSPASDDPQVLAALADVKQALVTEDTAIESALNPAPAANTSTSDTTSTGTTQAQS